MGWLVSRRGLSDVANGNRDNRVFLRKLRDSSGQNRCGRQRLRSVFRRRRDGASARVRRDVDNDLVVFVAEGFNTISSGGRFSDRRGLGVDVEPGECLFGNGYFRLRFDDVRGGGVNLRLDSSYLGEVDLLQLFFSFLVRTGAKYTVDFLCSGDMTGLVIC